MRQKSLLQSLTLRALLLVTLLVGSFGSAWADEAYYTLDTSVAANATTANNYASNGTVTVDGIGWTFNGNGQIQPWRIGGKSLKGVDRIAYTTTPMDEAISKVDLTVGTASGITVNSLNLVVASDASFNTVIDNVSQPFEASSTISFTPTSGDSWPVDAYYKFVFNVTVSVSSNKFVQFSKVEFYKASAAVSVESVSLNKNSTSLVVGGTETLTATVSPGNAANKNVTWSSNNTGVATVEDGVVTAVAPGNATITVTTEDGSETATCVVTVTAPVVDNRTAVNMTGFTATSTTLVKGGTTETSVTNDQNGWTAAYTYESSNESVATVDEDGVITAVAKGEATITASLDVDPEDANYKAGETTSMTVDITVNNPSHTVTFSVNGETSTDTKEEGATIEFPANPAAVLGKQFMGWVVEAIDGTTDEEPTWVTSATMGESDVNYYAVFATLSGEATNDILNNATTGVSGTSYKDWSGKTASSSAVYAGNSAGGNETIQLRSTSNAGIISTTSGGKVSNVSVDWFDGTASERTLNVYGSNTAYTNVSDLYSNTKQGTLLGTIVKGTSTEVTVSGNYAYVGVRSNSGALYLNELTITWGSASYSDYCTTVANVAVESVSLNKTSTTIIVGNEETLEATIDPNNASNKNVTWTSSDEAVATVENGLVTAVAVGTATITVTTVDGENTATCVVTVVPVPVESVSLNKTATTLGIGDTETLTATVSPNDAANKNVTWSSNNTDVATVSNGVVTAVAAGEATITVTTEDGGKTATCVVTVTAPVAVTGVSLDETELNLFVGDTETLTATIAPAEATNKNVTWTSSDEAVATVDGGVVTAVAVGTATITVTTVDGSKTATCEVTVTAAPGTLANPYTVEQARAAIDAGTGVTGVYATGIVSEIVTAYNSTYGNISYNISADGETTSDQLQAFRGKSYNGEFFTSEDDIQVGDVVVIYGNLKKYNSTYEFDKDNQLVSLVRKTDAELAYETTSYNANLGEAFATPELTNPNDLTVTYSSSNTDVATVNAETGAVALVAAGETTITATFAGNASYKEGSASYTLTVVDPSEPVDICVLNSITPTTLTIGDMGDFVLNATFEDGVVEGDDYEISWSSSDTDILEVAGTTYEAKAAGTVTVTVSVEVLDETTYNNVQKEFTVTVQAPKTYVALVAEYDGGFYALTNETKASNKLVATAVDAVNGKVIGKADNISWVITEGDGTATIQDVDENYLTGSSNTNITLGNSTYSWNVDEENHSWYKGTRSFIYQESNDCFGNYATSNVGKTGYSGYTTAYTFADGYTRTVTADNFGTICLPYDVAADDFSGVKFYKISGKRFENEVLKSVVLEEVSELIGGCAYIFKANEDATKLIAAYSGDEVDTPFDAEDSETGLQGTYTKQFIPVGNYVLKNNKIYYVNEANYVNSGANKAYIDLTHVPDADANNVKGFELFSGDDDNATAIHSLDALDEDAVIYNLAGQRVQKAGRGVYVVNGRKVVVK